MSAVRHGHPEELAVLTRANHDMRSPLSVIMGVFELLEDTERLSESERRYLALGTKAAEELLRLADALRLYSAVGRNLMTLEALPVDLTATARDRLRAAVAEKPFTVSTADAEPAPLAIADPAYLDVAFAGLARHLTAHLPDPDPGTRQLIGLHTWVDDQNRVTVRVALENGGTVPDRAAPATEPAMSGQDDLDVINGIRLIELMGGAVVLGTAPLLMSVTLPASAQSTAS